MRTNRRCFCKTLETHTIILQRSLELRSSFIDRWRIVSNYVTSVLPVSIIVITNDCMIVESTCPQSHNIQKLRRQ